MEQVVGFAVVCVSSNIVQWRNVRGRVSIASNVAKQVTVQYSSFHRNVASRPCEINCSVVRTQIAFRRNTRIINHPSPRCIRFIVDKFKAEDTVADRQHPDRSRTVRSIDNIEFVRHDVTSNPQRSVGRRSEELQISKNSLRRILREYLK